MLKRSVRLTSAAGCVLAVTALSLALVGVGGPRRIVAGDSNSNAPSFGTVTVWGIDTLDPDTQVLYRQLADAVATVQVVPNDRLNFYAYHNDGVNWIIGSWGSSVTDAQPNPNGGYDVTLVVGPAFAKTPYEAQICVSGGYSEVYWVDPNGNVQFLGAQDPDNRAGGPLDSAAF